MNNKSKQELEHNTYVPGQLIAVDIGALVGSRDPQKEWRVVKFIEGPSRVGQIYIEHRTSCQWVWDSWTRPLTDKELREHHAKEQAERAAEEEAKKAKLDMRVLYVRTILEQLLQAHERHILASAPPSANTARNPQHGNYERERYEFAYGAALSMLTKETP